MKPQHILYAMPHSLYSGRARSYLIKHRIPFVAAPMTSALLGADALLIPAIVVYLLLHRAISARVEG